MKRHRINHFIIVLIAITFSNLIFAQNIILSGYVKDSDTGENLIGATIYEKESKLFSVTNNYGYYNLVIPKGVVNIEVSYIGYDIIYTSLNLEENKTLDFEMIGGNYLDEVVIVAQKEKPIEKRTEMSVISIPVKQIKALPSLGGESDVIKSLQLMPGVQSGNEGSSQLFVRGGSTDQNLILLDDVPMYYVSHMGGFVSTFNTDAINNIKLIKGGFPAMYGSRLSSVVDIRMKEGNLKKFEGNAMIGIISSKVSIEGPIKKDTTSYIISARRLLYDLISRAAYSFSSSNELQTYHFYDINAKINHRFSNKNHLYFSVYFGDDRNFYKTKDKDDKSEQQINDLKWGNGLLALRWNHLYNQKLFSNTTFSYTRYRFLHEDTFIQTFNDETEKLNSKFNSGIYDAALKTDFDYFVHQNYKLKFGVSATHHTFNPGISSYKYENQSSVQDTIFNNQRLTAIEGALYVENKFKIGKRVRANIGLRYNIYNIDKKSFHSYEPRILTNFLLTKNLSIKASYAEMQQNIHLLTTSGVGMPIDLWVPATKKVVPEKSKQFALGIAKTINKEYEFSMESYYKSLENLTTYKEGENYSNPTKSWQDKVETDGKGTSYGVEFLFQKKHGNTTGWLGYTWSKTTRQFDNVNFGKVYPYRYDRRHDFSIVANHRITKNIDVSATWVYGTGNAITLATSKYEMINTPLGSGFTINPEDSAMSEVRYYSGKNGFRMRDFHKLDIGVRLHKKRKHGTQTWNFSIYNVYNRQNPLFYFFHKEYEYDTSNESFVYKGTKLKQRSLFPIIPSVSYSFKF